MAIDLHIIFHASQTNFLRFFWTLHVLVAYLRFKDGVVNPPSIMAISSSQMLCCWVRLWLTINRINPWWQTTNSTCCAFFMLRTISWSNEFKNEGKFTEHFCFNMVKSLRCHSPNHSAPPFPLSLTRPLYPTHATHLSKPKWTISHHLMSLGKRVSEYSYNKKSTCIF